MTDNVMTPVPKPVPRIPEQRAENPMTGEPFEPDDADALIQEYATVGERYAPLYARYGNGNMTERLAKSLISAIMVEVREAKREAGAKFTVDEVESEANADPRVKRFLEETESGRVAYQQAEIELQCVRERIRRLDAVTRRGI